MNNNILFFIIYYYYIIVFVSVKSFPAFSGKTNMKSTNAVTQYKYILYVENGISTKSNINFVTGYNPITNNNKSNVRVLSIYKLNIKIL